MENDRKRGETKGLYLDLLLTPSQSMSRRGFHILMAIATLISLIVGGFFLILGAWPVFGFFGLDILLLYLAFKSNFRAGRIKEHICLNDKSLTVTRTQPNGDQKHYRFGAAWVKVTLDCPTPYKKILLLIEKGHQIVIGAFLPPDERQSVAQIIQAGLDRRKDAMIQQH